MTAYLRRTRGMVADWFTSPDVVVPAAAGAFAVACLLAGFLLGGGR